MTNILGSIIYIYIKKKHYGNEQNCKIIIKNKNKNKIQDSHAHGNPLIKYKIVLNIN